MDARSVGRRVWRIALTSPQVSGAIIGTVGMTVIAVVWRTWWAFLAAAVLWVVGISAVRELWRKVTDDG